MSKPLGDILTMPECTCLKVLAGHKGLKNQVDWISAIEAIGSICFANEGDLNFVTGIVVSSEEELLLLVQEAFKYNMSGIVFAPGPYIQEIPQCIIDFADQHEFPVLTMPWDVKISTLSHKIGQFISNQIDTKNSSADILRSILLDKDVFPLTPESIEKLYQSGLIENSTYRVILFKIKDNSSLAEEKLKAIYEALTEGIYLLCFNEAITFRISIGLVAVLSGNASMDIAEKIEELKNLANKTEALFSDDYTLQFGIGNPYNDFEGIRKSFEEALLVTNLFSVSPMGHNSNSLYRYDQLGAYKIIWESKKPNAMLKFSLEMLSALIAYDQNNSSDLMKFLNAYFEYNGNVKMISTNLFLHKNTVAYKIRKIESILGISFTSLEDLLNLKLALMIREVHHDRNVRF